MSYPVSLYVVFKAESNAGGQGFTSVTMSQKFFWDGEGIESLNRYKPGWYHPVHIGDRYPTEEPRYQIFHKLGYGTFSTVWLAQDLRFNRMVAVKIAAALTKDKSQEIAILRSLPSSPHFPRLLDSFTIVGPNGQHDVLVTEILLFARFVQGWRPEKFDIKTVAREVLQGLAVLHESGISHNDLHLGNIALRVPRLARMSPEEWLEMLPRPSLFPILPRDSQCENSQSLPKYVVESLDLQDADDEFGPPLGSESDHWDTVIADFGAAYYCCDPPRDEQKTGLAPLAVRPPESFIMLKKSGKYSEMSNGKWGMQGDVWSLACTMYEMQYYRSMYAWLSESHILEALEVQLGPLPPYLRHLLPDDHTPASRKYELDDESQLSNLLDLMLKYEPSERPSAQDLLRYSYFSRTTCTNS